MYIVSGDLPLGNTGTNLIHTLNEKVSAQTLFDSFQRRRIRS